MVYSYVINNYGPANILLMSAGHVSSSAAVYFPLNVSWSDLSYRKNAWLGADFRWPAFINWPLECAAARCNDLSELVLMLGADVNNGIGTALRFNAQGRQKQTILDAVRGVVAQAKKDLEAMEKSVQTQNQGNGEKEKFGILAKMDGWKGALGKRLLKIMEEQDAKGIANQPTRLLLGAANGSTEANDHLRRSIEYFAQLEEDLLSRGAKTWKELHPDEDSVPGEFYRTGFYGYYGGINVSTPGFTKMSGPWSAVEVPSHQTALYEELFEACCAGDNVKIEALCLPKKGKDGQELIQITARFGEGWGTFSRTINFHTNLLTFHDDRCLASHSRIGAQTLGNCAPRTCNRDRPVQAAGCEGPKIYGYED